MRYSALNRTAEIIAKESANLIRDHKLVGLVSVKNLPDAEPFGFIGVKVLIGDNYLSCISVDTFNNQITDTKTALQYLSLRITKLIEKYGVDI